MTKKKRNHPNLDEILARPWCYYCERDFDDLKILINHQKAKHFKCERCGRRLNTAGGLNVHMSQVHKEALSAVDNALPNRAGLDIEIFGMEGIPEDIIQQHTQRVVATYHQNIADRQENGGQGGTPGAGSNPNPAKKPKFESPSDLKKRLAEHKAKLAAEQAGGSSGSATPQGAGQGQSPGSFGSLQYQQQPQHPPPSGSPIYPQQQPTFSGPPGATQYPPHPPPYNNGTGSPFGYSQPPSQSGGFAQGGYPPNPSFSPPPSTYPPQQSPHAQAFSQQYPPPGMAQFSNIPHGAPASPYNAQSPLQYQHSQQPQMIPIPPQNGSLPARPGSLPPAPGLPQRPAFEAPQVNAFQMQQLHQGQIPGSQPSMIPQPPGANEPSSLDDLISGASKQAEETAKAQATTATPPSSTAVVDVSKAPTATSATDIPTLEKKLVEEQGEEKAGKKDKDKSKSSRLVYADNEVSPEEKMAGLPRYAVNVAKVGA